jgi:hypothetical protein
MKKIAQADIVQDYVAKANIDRFRLMLKTETDPIRRGVISGLLAAEEKRQMAPKREATEC